MDIDILPRPPAVSHPNTPQPDPDPDPDGLGDFWAGIDLTPPDCFATPSGGPGPDTVTPYSLIGRDGGRANGEIDPTTVQAIVADPSRYGVPTGQWHSMRHGCPMAHGSMHPKGKGIAILVDGSRLVLTCRHDGHAHPGWARKTDAQGRDYWTIVVDTDPPRAAGGPRRNRFPPFTTGSHTDIAQVLLRTVLAGAEYDSPDTIRLYDSDVGDSGALHRRGARRPSPTAGKWIRLTTDNIKFHIQGLDNEWIEVGTAKDGTPKYRRLEANSGTVDGVYAQIMTIVRHRRSRQDGGTAHDGSLVSRFDVPGRPCIPVRGAVLDLETYTFVGPDASAASSYYACAEHTIPIDPWPTVGDNLPTCSRWGSYLHSVWPQSVNDDFAERVAFLQEWIGVALAGETVRSQVHTMLMGDSGSGKSQIIDVVSALFPVGSRIAVGPTQLGRFDLAPFGRARINAVAEVHSGGVANAAAMKALQSGDLIQVERKYGQPYYIRSRCAWLLACNSAWRPSENDDSVYRRWTVLSFDRRVSADRRVTDIGRSIVDAEMQGIVAWAVLGYLRYVENGRRYTVVPSSADAIAAWRQDVEPLRQWIEECTVPADTLPAATATTLLTHYLEWAKKSGYRTLYSAASFGRELRKLGLVKTHSNHGNTWGIALRPTALHDDPVVSTLT